MTSHRGSGRTSTVCRYLALICATAAGLAVAPAMADRCRDGVVELRGDWGQARFSVEIADTAETRARGLMFRETMPRSAGMLFLYDNPGPAVFWMRNTLIPLDMIFIEADGRVATVHDRAVPLDETPIFGGQQILAVLEINGGMAEAMGITVDSVVRHPRLPQDSALWPCEAASEAPVTEPAPAAAD